MKTEFNDPIMPTIEYNLNGDISQGFGLTKREHFAALAMQGMLHNGAMTQHGVITQAPESIAELAVNQADALIAALNKEVANGE